VEATVIKPEDFTDHSVLEEVANATDKGEEVANATDKGDDLSENDLPGNDLSADDQEDA
jgi:hypothetical protein